MLPVLRRIPGRALVLALVAACAPLERDDAPDLPRSGGDFANRPENFQFAIVGDRTGGHRAGVFGHAMVRINQLQPEFVVGVGDLIEGYKDTEEELTREWDEFDRLVDRLDMPFFYTVGNHDTGNELSLDVWRKRYGPDYYHFRYQDVLFISLNTEDPPVLLSKETLARQAWLEETMRTDPGKVRQLLREHRRKNPDSAGKQKLPGQVAISDAQVQWLGQVLEDNSDVRWTILLMHKPAWEYDSPAFERIEQLLADRPYTVFAGHEHYYGYSRRRESDYITMATTGGIWLNEDNRSFDHIAWVTMTDEGPVVSIIALCGLLGTPAEAERALGSGEVGELCLHPPGEKR